MNIANKYKLIFSILILAILIIGQFSFTFAAEINSNKIKGFNNSAPEFNLDMIIVSALVIIIIILFLLEPIPVDVIALSIPVILVALQPWTKVTPDNSLSGFANQATITVLAMFILSEGVQNSGAVQILGDKIAEITGDNQNKQLTIITYLSGSIASILNNTPVVATFIPMVNNLARKTKKSPSKLLIPLSYASMMGGVMTLLGTSTNLLASDISARLIDHPFSIFEFTKLGIIVFIFGSLYLITIGHRLIPERIDPEQGLFKEYEVKSFLTEVVVQKNSPLIDQKVCDTLHNSKKDINLVKIVRNGKEIMEPLNDRYFKSGDHLIFRTDKKTLFEIIEQENLNPLTKARVTQKKLEEPQQGQNLIEAVIPSDSFMIGQTLTQVNFAERYDATILAFRRGEELKHGRMDKITIEPGDVILLLVTESTLDRLKNNNNFIIEEEEDTTPKHNNLDIIKSLTIVLGVIITAGLNIMPISIAALGGSVIMTLTGCITPNQIYESINWKVIFLLAGLIPLGIAIEKSGTAYYLANQLLEITSDLPLIIILTVFYLFTALLTNLISNNASVVLMIPIAVNAAQQLGANPFAFVLAVTFAASTAFLTPIGYQTNLMIYGPGGYKFRDFMIVGAPLQILLAIITPLFIALFWGL